MFAGREYQKGTLPKAEPSGLSLDYANELYGEYLSLLVALAPDSPPRLVAATKAALRRSIPRIRTYTEYVSSLSGKRELEGTAEQLLARADPVRLAQVNELAVEARSLVSADGEFRARRYMEISARILQLLGGRITENRDPLKFPVVVDLKRARGSRTRR